MFSFDSKPCTENEIQKVIECLNKGWLAPGDNATELEKMASKICGLNFGLLVNSRKSALLLSFLSCGISKGTKVFLPTEHPIYQEQILTQIGAIIEKEFSNDIEAIILTGLDPIFEIPNNKNLIIIEDFGSNISKKKFNSKSSIVTFEGLCALILFESEKDYYSALRMRDWGRVGTQSEEFNGRYSNWVLGDVRYDWKFVFNELGFNFKSCEMSATIALEKLKLFYK